ncbi:MAG: FAD:protein FMN transferase, partial [Alphaproteobacteria bacterium]
MMNRRTVMLGTAGLLLTASMPVRAAGARVLGGIAFGSYWRLTIPEDVNGEAAGESVEAVIGLVDNAMSPYLPASDLSRFNRAKSTNWAPMSDVTSTVIDTALHVAARTGGAFDPTVGPIVGRYGFGPIHDGSTSGSYLGLEVRAGAVRKDVPDLTIDLC